MTQREDVLKFEQGRIKALQEERLYIQKKTFTKWMNSFLQKARMEVDDLFEDLADGKKLLKLLEIISGEKLGKPNNGRMRVHKVENVNKSLAFLHTKVRLESIGAEDIVDGNRRLILGLIWTIILRFQIQEIEIDVDEENESSEKKSAKDALLLWCQRKTTGYPGVNIQDFSGSWRSGLGFNALIHAHRPDLINFNQLNPTKHIDNLNNAFDIANNELGIPRLLDAEDVDTNRPDEKSVITYVASYYHTFARMKNEMKSGRRIANIVGQMMDADKMKVHYERLTTDLLEWIRMKILELEDRNFPNSLEGIQKELLRFKQYRTIEKPPKYKERSEIEALYFHINTQLKSLNQPPFSPPDGQLIHDLERCWEELEGAEHRREVALRQELLRQERLEQLNYKFERKSVLREGYLKEMIQVLSDSRYGSSLAQVDATVKKHEAISADILAREERFHDLRNMSEELVRENYRGKDRVVRREAEVMQRWGELLQLLDKHRANLTLLCSLMAVLRETDTILATINDLEVTFQSEDVGPHLLAVEDLLQKHSLTEMQVSVAMGETVRRLNRQGQQYISSGHKEAPLLQTRLEQLNTAHNKLMESSKRRRARLEEARNFYQFVEDIEDEDGWLIEKQRICTAGISAKDLRAILSLQQKHKVLMDEMKVRRPKSEQVCEAGRTLISDKHPRSDEINSRIRSLQEHRNTLNDLAETRKKQFEDAAEAFQFYADANEAESWLNERLALVASVDYGEDEPSAQALLARHRDLQGELNAYKGDIQSLSSQAAKLIESGISTFELSGEPEVTQELEEWVKETRLVPQEVWEEEPVERIEHRTVMEERSVAQVKSLYPFSGQGMLMAKGEVMFLLNKTNPDWWSVRKANGQDGFVPANYVREIEPKLMPVPVRRAERVRTMQRVRKTKMVKQVVPVKKIISPKATNKTPGKRLSEDSSQNIEKRQSNINATYNKLQDFAQRRHALLEDSIRLFGFYRECDDFEKWIKDKEKMLRAEDKVDSVETAKRKYEKFLTDLSASSKRIEALDKAVEEFVRQGHSQLDKVRARQKHIHQLWDHLNWLKGQKERSLEGASSVELFQRTCDEARDWMSEKMTQLDTAELGPDLKTVQALQRRHQQLERELAPVEEKVNRVHLLANSVKSSYPNEKTNVNTRQKEIQDLWEKVKAKAVDRRSRLENAVGQQIFMNSSKNLLSWVSGVKDALNADESARDVVTAENLLKKHQELGDDITAHQDEFQELADLGSQLLARNKSLVDVKERLDKLSSEQEAIGRGWKEKENWLRQCLDLQLLNKEADHIDTTTSSHDAFLEFTDLGGSIDDVEALLKRHEDFENTLYAQDDRIKLFNEIADKLIGAGHYDAKSIDDRRKQVLARRKAVKASANERHKALVASRNFQLFVADVEDLQNWLSEKLKTAGDESYRDLNNIERKLQKHEAFERELRANEGQLRAVNKTGQALISEGNRRGEVSAMLNDLNTRWEALVSSSLDKGRRLRQAAAQHTYNRTMEDAKIKLEEMDASLQSKEVGSDLRNCKQLLKKHQILENDISQWKQKIGDLVALGQEMAHEGHFDADNILKASQDCQEKFASLQEPARKRREALEESLRFHKFGFELETELGWIREHLSLASSETLGQNLHQAQSLHKKHKKLEAEIVGHQSMIDKTLASGEALVHQNHPETKQVAFLCSGLQDAWQDLEDKAAIRSRKLDLSLKAQQFFFEASEVESWLSEKNDVLNSTDYGRDRDAASKLLTKHKALELELDTYSGIVMEMGNAANTMVNAKHPDAKAIALKQQAIQQQLRTLQKLATARQQRLMESMCRHEYLLESAELGQWIRDQVQAAASDDYGQDYEHLLILQNKFDDLKHRVEAGSDRFSQCEQLAAKLIANDSPYTADIERHQEQLRESWQQLLSLMENREQRLGAAGEIHRFHRDVADALSRIQDKEAALSDDLGRDLNSVLALIRRHEGFENDLVALEAQLQVLVEDAVRLQSLYPGNNATHIAQQQAVVVSSWSALQERSAHHREMLQASCDLHRFLAQVRDLMGWASGLRTAMLHEEKVRDAASAQTLKAEHEAVKAEIEAREESFRSVMELGEGMVQANHYASQEIQERFAQLLEERQRLHSAWQHKKVHLDQLIDLHFFLRDAKQIDTLCGSQEVALSGIDFGDSVDEVSAHVKKHDAFEKLLATQEEKVLALQEHGDKLLAQNHFESSLIAKRLSEVLARRAAVKQLCAARRQRLEDALLHAQFVRDVAEAESWIDEKQKKLEVEASKGEVSSLEDKIKKLQKHQAFQAELTANQGRITTIKDKGDMLLEKKHKGSRDIKTALDRLLTAWRNLLQESNNRGRGLEEAQDILEFNNQVEKIEAWIRDKEMMVQAGDMGRDYEHCLALQRKLDDVDSDMRVDDSRIKAINSLADKLIRQGRSDTRSVQQRREHFNNKWRALQGALCEYREHLSGALEIHSFNRDVDDTSQRVAEKAVAMSNEDTGRDLAAVEHLQRKQEALERDMTAIDGKLKEHDVECRRLVQKYPDMSTPIRTKLTELQDNWRQLQGLSRARHDRLTAAYTMHKFRADLRELEVWVLDTIKRMGSSELPATIAEAQAALELHHERKAEIDGRQETFKTLKEFGLKLNPPPEEDLGRLEELRRTLSAAWEERRARLNQAHQLQQFREQADHADNWLATKEAFLNNEDLGDSLSGVEVLLRKHEAFEKTVSAQLSRIEELEKFGTEVLADHHYDTAGITQRLQGITARRDRLKESCAVRRRRLLESRQLHQFLRNMYEVEGWIIQKQQVASDENYRDPTNLQSKIQKHAAFESELAANRGRVGAVTSEGEALIAAGHFAGMEIQARLDELEAEWRSLLEASALKRERLNDAYQALVFNRTLEELETWIDEVEGQLQSEDHGKDLASVANLLKRHTLLENDVTSHGEQCSQLKDTATQFLATNHFMKEEIQDRADAVIVRYRSLQEPMQIRRDNLEDALLLHQFQRDTDDELQWIAEKEPIASSTDLGNSLNAVQSLQKKHQALEAEIASRDPVVAALTSRAQQMIRSGHFAANRIEASSSELQERLGQLRDLASVRRLRLLDAVESQMFYAEASEAEVWLKEKRPLLTSHDFGKDEDSVQSLLKKLEGLERELCAFQHTVGKLAKLSHGLVDRGHFDSTCIAKKQSDIENELSSMQQLAREREVRLIQSRKLFRFLRESEEVAEWIGDQTTVAASEDYGRDVEHVELLIQAFDSFLSGLSGSEGRVASCLETGRALVTEGNPDSDRIQAKLEETHQLWDDLKELAHARQEALAGAKQVHVFDRTADETISWIQEKDATLSSEGYGQDLETIQALVRKHQGFETDLAAVKEQVESVVEEAGRLAGLFPDAREHIEVKHEECLDAWTQLLEKAEQRKDKLQQAEQLQTYFDQYRDLMAWINEMIAKVTSAELAHDVPGAELLISRHLEHKAEINSRSDAFTDFYATGNTLIKQGHFLSGEIQDKIRVLEQRNTLLHETWEKRKTIYEQNLDTQVFKREADQLENWLQSREPTLHDGKYGDSIAQVEDLIRKHEDFEKTIQAQEDKFQALKRITLLEQAFQAQQEAEHAARQAEKERVERERIEARKRREVQRITDERRREGRRVDEVNGGGGMSSQPNSIVDTSISDKVNSMPMLDAPSIPSPIKILHGTTSASTSSSLPVGVINESDESESECASVDNYCATVGGGGSGISDMSSYSSYALSRSRSALVKLDDRPDAPGSPAALQKSSSISSLFGDRMRKGDIKRAESMKVDLKKPKRTPSFTTRRRTQSFRKLQKLEQLDQLPPVEIQGVLDRKHELQSGGKKAPVRSWKTLYTVLCGQLLCFFKDQDDFVQSRAATSPIIIFKAKCEKAEDYTKRKNVFRLCVTDGSEFLFLAANESEMEDWINKISFHAQLPPSLQLLSYDDNHKGGSPNVDRLPPLSGGDISSSSSRGSTPELTRRRSSSGTPGQYHHRNSMSSAGGGERPPVIPPRGAPPPVPVKTSAGNLTSVLDGDNIVSPQVQMRPPRPDGMDNSSGSGHMRPQSYQGINLNITPHHNGDTHSQSAMDLSTHHENPPPLPISAPPNRNIPHREPWPTDVNSYRHGTVYGNLTSGQRPLSTGGTNTNVVYGNSNRSATLPSYVPPPAPPGGGSAYQGPSASSQLNIDQRRQSESSSESEQPNAMRKDKRSNVLSNLFRKKRATNL